MDRTAWWQFTGTVTQIRRLGNTLRTNRHLQVNDSQADRVRVVVGKKTTLYLSCQFSEKGFVESVAKEHSATVKEVEPVEYGQAQCGKYTTSVVLHQRACTSCQQLRRNQTVAAGGGPPREPDVVVVDGVYHAEDAQKDAVRLIDPPCPPKPNDYASLAAAARETSEKLLTQSTYYSTLAERYESLTQPTKAIRQAEEALKAAQESAEEDRKEQVTALQALLEEGPPEGE
jgi:hypothetical protein